MSLSFTDMYSFLRRVSGRKGHATTPLPATVADDVEAVQDAPILEFEEIAEGYAAIIVRRLSYVEAASDGQSGTWKYADEHYSPYASTDIPIDIEITSHPVVRNPAVDSYEQYGDRADAYFRPQAPIHTRRKTKAKRRRLIK